ncbi:translation elongation factor Ts [Gammaproteobacteria bacterium]|jgi:elongation factor Ts|nr:translation elongation factor Ts [Gammaproteobacteria bacterium]MDA9356567.1 translation elongation factor Ts [Gammaproteobacteria bacterium]MDB2582365.1 translation elongation factor Ts [Gammaproteobacteria bacterium]MDB4158406.1 translation elongation factor Ts [Gammaproteobacteria bacterium]MDB4244489.1 translation elongation factor Ts [Gammaproteobacteria bacterium]|tara:strand:- start:2352 stop:3209 length:858 start_codon:yes stop_codon:yes gene_type:complete
MEVKASQVKELRDMTGVAMMECKKALVECDGDIEKALDLLRSNSALKAEKKASRVAADGILRTSQGDGFATLIEINSETDFAIKDSNFIAFTDEVHNYISAKKVDDISEFENSEIEEKRKALIQTIGENIQLRRLETLSVDSGMSAGVYLHSDSKLGALVVVSGGDESLAKDIAMHVAAFNPLCLSQDDIDPQVLEREKAIYLVQAEESGKPQEIMEKMIEGKLNRFLSEVSLMSQGFVKDPDTSIQKLLEANNAKIESFSRLKVGEGIEVSTKSFADEVAEQLK